MISKSDQRSENINGKNIDPKTGKYKLTETEKLDMMTKIFGEQKDNDDIQNKIFD